MRGKPEVVNSVPVASLGVGLNTVQPVQKCWEEHSRREWLTRAHQRWLGRSRASTSGVS